VSGEARLGRPGVDRGLGVTAAAGFSATGVACGIKPSGALDLAVVVGTEGTVAAGVFTTNLVVAAPVVWSRGRLAASADARVVVVNSGNANACTGPAGKETVAATARRAAAELGCRPEQVLVCSTGVIGVPLDADRVGEGIAKAAAALGLRGGQAVGGRPDTGDGQAAAEAIRTTDTVAKQAGVVMAGGVTVAGMAKGAAMLAPAMAPPPASAGSPSAGSAAAGSPAGGSAAGGGASGPGAPPWAGGAGAPAAHATMLAVLTTDALCEPAALRAGLAAAAEATFNRITVDGAQSTNDTVLLLASGASGARPHPDDLADAVQAICDDLALQMLADAEGATKVVSVHVGGAGTTADALAVARRVADSPLVKAAAYGGDPNWGRILQAAGTAGVAFDPGAVRLEIGGPGPATEGAAPEGPAPEGPAPEGPAPEGPAPEGAAPGDAAPGDTAPGDTAPGDPARPVLLVRDGAPTGADAAAAMAGPQVRIRLHLGGPGPWACVRTADLTPEYVRLNSEYTT
jgi:glutamate N-acetyltransferase / amino-acid N-acetyltransferase